MKRIAWTTRPPVQCTMCSLTRVCTKKIVAMIAQTITMASATNIIIIWSVAMTQMQRFETMASVEGVPRKSMLLAMSVSVGRIMGARRRRASVIPRIKRQVVGRVLLWVCCSSFSLCSSFGPGTMEESGTPSTMRAVNMHIVDMYSMFVKLKSIPVQ